jgi:hypothetical protein
MSYHKDDGTFVGGFFTCCLIALAFFAGYTFRDKGFKIQIPQQDPQTQVQK